ncbi:MAG: hypothetical protein JNN08_20350 [Bryobacterales bacterium]|nr:hypothetical protein [Bryobacterales bacterium]
MLSLLVFALATYARLSWYGQETLEKRYLVKSVKLMEARAKVAVDAELPAAAPRPLLVKPEPAEPVVVLLPPRLSTVLLVYPPTFLRPPPMPAV